MARSITYEQICKCCRKCGKTFHRKGNNQELLNKWATRMLRLHHKKCVGTLCLDAKQIDKICDAEQNAWGAPLKSLSKLDACHSYDIFTDELNVDMKEYIKIFKASI